MNKENTINLFKKIILDAMGTRHYQPELKDEEVALAAAKAIAELTTMMQEDYHHTQSENRALLSQVEFLKKQIEKH